MIILFFAAAALLLYILQRVYKEKWQQGLSARLRFASSYVYEGDSSSLYEVIENRKRLPVFILEVGFRIGRGVRFVKDDNTSVSDHVYKRDIYSLAGYERITRTIALTGVHRGHYPVSDVSMSAFSLFHTKRYLIGIPQDADIYVYAKRTPLSGIVPVLDSLLGEQESSRRFLEDPFAFASIRDYTLQDPMKNINWKASARAGELMVNTYASTAMVRLMILLDVEDSGIWKHQDLVEDGIRVAATMAQKYLAAGRDVGIAVNTKQRRVIAPAKGSRVRQETERMLTADFEKEDTIPVAGLFGEVPDDVMPVIISKNAGPETPAAVAAHFGRGRRVLLIVPHDRGEAPSVSRAEGVQVVLREAVL